MLQFDEYKVKLNNLLPGLEALAQALDLESAERELDMLQAESAADGFWDNLAKAQKVQQRIKNLQDKVEKQTKRKRQWDDLMALCEMGNEFEDESLVPELEEGFAQLEQDMESARLQTLLTGEQSLQSGRLHILLQLGKALLQLGNKGFVLKLVAHLAQGHQVIPLSFAFGLLFHLVLQILDALLHLLGLGKIIPESVGRRLGLQHIQLPLGALQVQSLCQRFQSGQQIIQLYFILVKLEHRPYTLLLSVVFSPTIIYNNRVKVKKNPTAVTFLWLRRVFIRLSGHWSATPAHPEKSSHPHPAPAWRRGRALHWLWVYRTWYHPPVLYTAFINQYMHLPGFHPSHLTHPPVIFSPKAVEHFLV